MKKIKNIEATPEQLFLRMRFFPTDSKIFQWIITEKDENCGGYIP